MHRINRHSTIRSIELEDPVRFSESVEQPAADEAETIQGLIATMRYINERTFADGARDQKCAPSLMGFYKVIWR